MSQPTELTPVETLILKAQLQPQLKHLQAIAKQAESIKFLDERLVAAQTLVEPARSAHAKALENVSIAITALSLANDDCDVTKSALSDAEANVGVLIDQTRAARQTINLMQNGRLK